MTVTATLPVPAKGDGSRAQFAEGSEVGGYTIGRELGSGAMGTVYAAHDGAGNQLAIKFLRRELDADADGRAVLEREVAALRRLKHPAVVRVIDAELDGADAFIVTELVDGVNLQTEIDERGPLDPLDLYELADQLAAALEAVHLAGVVHRDLKPSNVMITDHGPVLIDFGIAADPEATTRPDLVVGTPGYLDPELVLGATPTVGTDWWSWAAVLAFAATGRPPFGTVSVEDILARTRDGRADLVGLRPRTAQALAAALHPVSRTRWTPTEVIRELRRDADAYAAALRQSSEANLGAPPPPPPELLGEGVVHDDGSEVDIAGAGGPPPPPPPGSPSQRAATIAMPPRAVVPPTSVLSVGGTKVMPREPRTAGAGNGGVAATPRRVPILHSGITPQRNLVGVGSPEDARVPTEPGLAATRALPVGGGPAAPVAVPVPRRHNGRAHASYAAPAIQVSQPAAVEYAAPPMRSVSGAPQNSYAPAQQVAPPMAYQPTVAPQADYGPVQYVDPATGQPIPGAYYDPATGLPVADPNSQQVEREERPFSLDLPRPGLAFAALLPLAVLAGTRPVLALTILAVVVMALRVVGEVTQDLAIRRYRAGGRRGTDGVVVAAKLPVNVLRGVVGALPQLLMGTAAGVLAVVGLFWVFGPGRLILLPRPDYESQAAGGVNQMIVYSALLALALAVAALVTWFGTNSWLTRAGARWAVNNVVQNRTATIAFLVAALITTAIASRGLFTSPVIVDWWPFPTPPIV